MKRFKPHPIWLAPLLGLLVSVFWQGWIVFHSQGGDWAFSQLQAQVFYSWLHWPTADSPRGDFPYFSYLYNAGIYLTQDPQGLILSPIHWIMIAVFGPEAGLRWCAVFLAAVGFVGMYAFLRTWLSIFSSTLGTLAWMMSLGIAWHLVAGHDMFAWMWLTPVFLLLLTRLDSGAALGLVGGLYLLGPFFHSAFYLLLPALALGWMTLPRLRNVRALIIGSLLALAIGMPRILSFASRPVTRAADLHDGVISVGNALYSLVATARVQMMAFPTLGALAQGAAWTGIWETNTALFAPALLLAVWGVFCRHRRPQHQLWVFALTLVGFGIIMASSASVWDLIHRYLPGVRVGPRFLICSALGLSILCGLALESLGRKARWILGFAASLAIVAQGTNWIVRAHAQGTLSAQPTSPSYGHPQVLSLPQAAWDPGDPQALLKGYIVRNGVCPIGSGCPRSDSAEFADDPVMRAGAIQQKFKVGHTWIEPVGLLVQLPTGLPLRTSQPIRPYPDWSLWISISAFCGGLVMGLRNGLDRLRSLSVDPLN